MAKLAYETIRYEKKDAIGTITLNRPESFNALTPVMNKEITKVLQVAERDSEIRCILLTGEGKAFCAGQDLKTVDQGQDTDYGQLLRENYHPMVKAFQTGTKPTVAAVNGVAAGAGMSIALAADFRVVTAETKFVSAFMGIGLVPDAGFMYILPRLIGYAKALEIATVGRPVTGEEAVRLGLANEMIATDDWEEGVRLYAQQLANMPTKAFSLVKRYMMNSMHESFETFLDKEADAQRVAGLTADHQEGIQAFIEKREPIFKGE